MARDTSSGDAPWNGVRPYTRQYSTPPSAHTSPANACCSSAPSAPPSTASGDWNAGVPLTRLFACTSLRMRDEPKSPILSTVPPCVKSRFSGCGGGACASVRAAASGLAGGVWVWMLAGGYWAAAAARAGRARLGGAVWAAAGGLAVWAAADAWPCKQLLGRAVCAAVGPGGKALDLCGAAGPGGKALDFCAAAGPGGKALDLCAAAGPGGKALDLCGAAGPGGKALD
eukprot:113485-Chlamydomonas_euryale.AAC.1